MTRRTKASRPKRTSRADETLNGTPVINAPKYLDAEARAEFHEEYEERGTDRREHSQFAGFVGGRQRWRGHSHGLPLNLKHHSDLAAAFLYFPTTKETPAQASAFRELVTTYLRHEQIYRQQEVSASYWACVFRLSQRAAEAIVKEVREAPYPPLETFILDLLRGMFLERFSGLLGMRKTATTRMLFGRVFYFLDDARAWLSSSCEYELFCKLRSAFLTDYRQWRHQ